ncbi:MAG: hypothetical protein AUK44_01325 [Porphyromonadaceae bacterium CG2_30_38_12]|nr:MAG: hypothetical protein AUK44_01325 [Porphyromonadaceae bacterium CG2_30_38_12]
MILVTGATGLVGGHLLWHLLQENELVYATRRCQSNVDSLRKIFQFYSHEPEKYLQRIIWRTADVCNKAEISDALTGMHTVYHCAAIVSLSDGNEQLVLTNVRGTAFIVQAAITKKVQQFCFVSSIAACGRAARTDMVDENSNMEDVKQRSAYALSKYYAEQEVWSGIAQGLNAVIVNPGVILGYSGTQTGSAALFNRVRRGLPFYTLGGSGYVDVQDVVKIMMALVARNISAERYIVVAQNCSNKQIIDAMADGFGKKRPRWCLGKKTLLALGFAAEMWAMLVGTKPFFDRSLARTASYRAYYSNHKISYLLHYPFHDIKSCIKQVCDFSNEAPTT